MVRKRRKTWDEMKTEDPEEAPLTKDKIEQLNDPDGEYVTWEEAKEH